MTENANTINIPIPGSPSFERDVVFALTRIREALGPEGLPTFSQVTSDGETVTAEDVADWDSAASSAHTAVTLGTANGLTLAGQALSLPTTASPTFGTVRANTGFNSNGTAGATANVAVAKDGGGVRTLHFSNGLYTGYTDS